MADVKVTPELIEQALAEVDWAKIDAMTDADIRRQIAEDPDVAPETLDVDPKILFTDKIVAPIALQVRLLRTSLKLSQVEFGRAFGIPPATVRNWEQKIRTPDQASISLLRLIANDPDGARRVLGAQT